MRGSHGPVWRVRCVCRLEAEAVTDVIPIEERAIIPVPSHVNPLNASQCPMPKMKQVYEAAMTPRQISALTGLFQAGSTAYPSVTP